MKIANDQKPRYSCLLYGHGYQIQEFQNFIIPSTWLSYPTASKHCYACYGFLIPQFQNFADLSPWKIFWIGNPSSYILVSLEIGRNYISPVMSIVIIIVSIITLLVSQNIFVGFFIPMSHGVNKKTRPSAFPNLPLPYQVFTRIIYCLTKKYLINFLLLW